MPPKETPKKAAKKSAKKAAKKSAKKSARHSAGRDMRRAYEHLGRIEVLDSLAGDRVDDVATLVALAQQELAAGYARNGAELLRATEHLGFAILTSLQPPARISPELEASVVEEFEDLLGRAEEHAPRESKAARKPDTRGREAAARLGQQLISQAREALEQRIFRRALELARAAECLTHLEFHGPPRLREGRGHQTLKH